MTIREIKKRMVECWSCKEEVELKDTKIALTGYIIPIRHVCSECIEKKKIATLDGYDDVQRML